MAFLFEYGLFLAKAITIVAAVVVITGVIFSVTMRGRSMDKEHIEVKNLNDRYDSMAQAIQSAVLPKKALKEKTKEWKKQAKIEDKKTTEEIESRKRIFVLEFDGDIRGSAVASLREEISAVLTTATEQDEVLVNLESAGGMVHAYGLASSQLVRVRDAKIPLTVAVDKVAASGGYMMACVADKILSAPFAIIGSIGVLTQIPNFHKVLQKNDIDFEQITAGEYKRTITMFGETTDKAREKLKEEIEETHDLFKNFVKQQRPQVDIAEVATGEHWLGKRALELRLVDELRTSDDYLLAAHPDADIYQVTFTAKQGLLDKLSSMLYAVLGRSKLEPTNAANHRYFV